MFSNLAPSRLPAVVRTHAFRMWSALICLIVFAFCAASLPLGFSVHAATVAASAPSLIISEFRRFGTNGANDEFIEIYNNADVDHTVGASDGSAGYAVVASDGITRFTIPNGTVIPARGHYLGCNSVGYSLASYPAGNGTTATCDATYTTDIAPNAGIALFNTAQAANFTLANRLDAVGPTAEANTLYKEGTGVRNLLMFSIAHSYVRRVSGGCLGTNPGTVDSNCTTYTSLGSPAPSSPLPQDTNNNRADFIFVDTNGTQASSEGSQQRLGAPGPENLTSPIGRSGNQIVESLVDSSAPIGAVPNRVRDLTNDPAQPNDTFGKISIRRRFTNTTGANVTRLRFRIVDITTFPSAVYSLPTPPNNFCGAPGSQCAADLRPLTSSNVVVTTTDPLTCSTTPGASAPTPPCSVPVRGTTLEQASGSENQPNGGGYNSTLSAGTITLAQPLANNTSINLQFVFGIQQQGRFRVAMVIEALPGSGSQVSFAVGNTVGQAPTAANNAASSLNAGNFVDVNVLANDTDPDGEALTVTAVTQPAHGTAQINPGGTVRYTPNASFTGTDVFAYTVRDSSGEIDEAQVTITVNQVPLPDARDDTASTNGDTPVTVSVLANDTDPDGDALTVTAVTQPTNGAVTRNANSTVTYTPNASFIGTDTFTYTVNDRADGSGGSDSATVTVTVTFRQYLPLVIRG